MFRRKVCLEGQMVQKESNAYSEKCKSKRESVFYFLAHWISPHVTNRKSKNGTKKDDQAFSYIFSRSYIELLHWGSVILAGYFP